MLRRSFQLLKDKNDYRGSGLAAPRKSLVKEEGAKKVKTEDDKEKRKQERLEREKKKNSTRVEQLAKSGQKKMKEDMRKLAKVGIMSSIQSRHIGLTLSEAELKADAEAELENIKNQVVVEEPDTLPKA